MKQQIITIVPACLLSILSQTALAQDERTMASIESWQMQMIYHPSQSFLKREDRGFVNIYDGFTDVQVEKILDDKFDRIDHMMFSRVKVTDIDGAVKRNPDTGYAMVEDDGCE